MLNRAQINAASDNIDTSNIYILTAMIKRSSRYANNPELYSNIETKINTLNGSIKAKHLNVVLDLIEEHGTGEYRLAGGDDALYYSHKEERESLINYAIDLIFTTTVPLNYIGNGKHLVGHRESSYCRICNRIHLHVCRSI